MFFRVLSLFLFIFIFIVINNYSNAQQDSILGRILCGIVCTGEEAGRRAQQEADYQARLPRNGYPISTLEAEKEMAKDFAENVKPGGSQQGENKAYDFPKDQEAFNWACGENGENCKFSPAKVAQEAMDKFTKKKDNIELAKGQESVEAGEKTVDKRAFEQVSDKLRAKRVKQVKGKNGLVADKKDPKSWTTITVKAEKFKPASGN